MFPSLVPPNPITTHNQQKTESEFREEDALKVKMLSTGMACEFMQRLASSRSLVK